MRKILVPCALAALLCVRDAAACAPAPRVGEHVNVAEESAVIVWDAAAKTEHFIRRATFGGEGRDFGFLVPTPSVPVLAPAADDVFDRMRTMTTRRTEYRTVNGGIDWTPLFAQFHLWRKAEVATTAARPPVEVLSVQTVAGYEAAILNATDAAALSKWLDTNGYATTPDLAQWLEAYVRAGWIVSAFKIDKTSDAATVRTSGVRMSFTTERPFFPYREPASQREGSTVPRVLRVWFIGPERVQGRVGDQPWTGQLYWSEGMPAGELSGVRIGPGARMTAFEDEATPRPGIDDLYFERDADQRELVPPPYVETEIVRTNVPADLVLAPVLVVGFFVWRRRRRAVSSRTRPADRR